MGNVNKVELRRLAQAATAGDWEYRLGMVRTLPDSDGFVPVAVAPNAPKNWRKQRDANMEYIAAAKPSAVLALLDREAQAICEARHAEFQRDEAYAECARLRAELEACRKDAERYRWLRANNYDIGSYHPVHEYNASAWFEHLEDFDIDAAMKEDGV